MDLNYVILDSHVTAERLHLHCVKAGMARLIGVPRPTYLVVLGTAKNLGTGAEPAPAAKKRHPYQNISRAVPKTLLCKRGLNSAYLVKCICNLYGYLTNEQSEQVRYPVQHEKWISYFQTVTIALPEISGRCTKTAT